MRFISLFAGIGGFDLGLERAGMECVAQAEIDPFCLKVLEKHWPNVARFTDVRECGKHNLPPADLICGGFPCQPHSVAGKRRGAADDRDLWPEYRRIIGECRPDWMLAENVPGIRTTILDQVLSDLDDLGYSAGTLVVPACSFDAPHRRERIFIIAHPHGSAIRFERDDEKARDGSDPRGIDVSDAKSCAWRIPELAWEESIYPGGNGRNRNVANSEKQFRTIDRQETSQPGWCSSIMGNTIGARLEKRESQPGNDGEEQPPTFGTDWWAVEPPVGRVANGIPRRVDRLRSLGNAVVPQVVEWIGRQIMAVENTPSPPSPVGYK